MRSCYQIAILALCLVGVGCGVETTPASSTPGQLTVTATTGMIADAAAVVGGDHVNVTGLMGPGVDPHLYKATQGDLSKLSNADVIFYNGLHLEGRMADVLVKMAKQVNTVQVTESIPGSRLREPPEFNGHFDPHVWFDVQLWKFVVERIREAYKDIDPENAADYDANASAYLASLDALDEHARSAVATIPETARVLITAHDAFGYFGDAYGMTVMGLQGISTAAEYGLQDVDRLVNILVERKVKAVFVESSISSRSIEALIKGAAARGQTVVIGGELFSDAMGAADTAEGTYLGMVRHNVDTIVEALN